MYVVLGDPSGEVTAPALPHRLRPGARRPALRWRYAHPMSPSGDPASRTCKRNTVYVVLGDPAGEVAAPALPHRLRPGTLCPALRWRYSPAIRPPDEPEWRPGSPQRAAWSVAYGPPPGRRPGRHRSRLAAAAGCDGGGGFPHPGCVVPGRAPPPGRRGGPVAVTVAHRARARWRWFLARAGPGPSTRAEPHGREAAGDGGGVGGVDRRRSRSAAGLHPQARPSLLPRRPA